MMINREDTICLECPCCGGDGAESLDGIFSDEQPLICGCDGHVCVEEDGEVWINNFDCDCSTWLKGDPRLSTGRERACVKPEPEKLKALAWCGNSYYHDDYPQGNFDERCGACRRNLDNITKAVAAVTAERDAAREIVAKVNNTVLGSYGYFTKPDCVEAIDNLKAVSNDHWQQLTEAHAEIVRLKEEAAIQTETQQAMIESNKNNYDGRLKAEAALAHAEARVQELEMNKP